MTTEDWPTREAFEAWWRTNAGELNLMAIKPPPNPKEPEVVLNREWRRIVDHIDAWKARHGL